MSENNLQIQIVDRPHLPVVGLKIRTTMAEAMTECSRLWEQDFGPRMPELASFPGDSFGVSVLVDEQTGSFDYWAAMPHRPGDPVPEGMSLLDLPAGPYAECRLSSLAELAGAYQAVFQRHGADLKAEAPGYELYPADHAQTGRLTLYLPLGSKEKT